MNHLTKKIKLIILGALLGAVALAVIIVLILNNTDKAKFKKDIMGFAEDFSERRELSTFLSLCDRGMLGLEADVNVGKNNDFLIYNLHLGGKLYIESDAKELMLSEGRYRYGKDSHSFEVYLSPDEGYIDSDSLLDGRYGYVRGAMQGGLINSRFNSLSSSFLLIDSNEYSRLERILSLYDEGYDVELFEDISDYLETYSKLLIKAILENAEFSTSETYLTLDNYGALRVDARYLTVTGSDLVYALNELYTEIDEDEIFRELIIHHIAKITFIMGKDTGLHTDEYTYAAEKYENALAELSQLISELSAEQEFLETKFNAEIFKNAENGDVVSVALTCENEHSKRILARLYVDGENVESASRIVLEVGERSFEYVINEDSEEAYVSELIVNGATVGRLNVYRDYDTFRVDVYNSSERALTLEGVFTNESESYKTVSVYSVITGNEHRDITLKLTIDTEASMPKPKQTEKTLFSMNEEDLEKYVFPVIGSYEELYGAYELSIKYDSKRTLVFEGNEVALTCRKQDQPYKTYYGTFKMNNGIIEFDFGDGFDQTFFTNGEKNTIEMGEGYLRINGIRYVKQK